MTNKALGIVTPELIALAKLAVAWGARLSASGAWWKCEHLIASVEGR